VKGRLFLNRGGNMVEIRNFNNNFFKILVVLFSMGILGCASVEKEKTESAQGLYKQGMKQFNNKSFKKAEETFQNLMNQFPDSKIRSLALIGLGSSLYKRKEYEQAKFHFERFIEQYPANHGVGKAYYLKAMCSFRQMESYERDQTNTRLALEEFNNILKIFSTGKYAKLARQKKEICRQRLAMSLLYIGRYYYSVEAYQSVISRMGELMDNYPKQKFLDEATFLLGESYFKEDNKKKAYFVFRTLLKKYPKSKFVAEARNRLTSLKRL
jgi:outer membrane protein assembly factor BamD